MNKSYKVVFSKARGALMAVNEATSSVQAKGTKTVVAAAVAALVAGAAMAETDATPFEFEDEHVLSSVLTPDQDLKIKTSLTIAEGANLTLNSHTISETESNTESGLFNVQGGQVNVTDGGINTNITKISGGVINIVGKTEKTNNWQYNASLGAYYDFAMTGGEINLGDNARLWIGEGEGGQENDNGTTVLSNNMVFSGGKLAMNGSEGKYAIIATMTKGNWSGASEPIYSQAIKFSGTEVAVNGYGAILSRDMTLSGGSITVAKGGSLQLLAQKELNTDGSLNVTSNTSRFTEGAFKMTGGKFSIAEGGSVTANLDTFSISGGTLSNEGTLTAKSVDISNGGVIDNAGKFTAAGGLTIGDGGVFHSTTLTADTFAVPTITIEEGGVLSMDQLNSNQSESGADNSALLVAGNKQSPLTVNLNGGSILLGNAVYQGDIKIGAQFGQGIVNVDRGTYEASRVHFGNSTTASSLTIGSDAKFTIGTLDLTNGEVTNNGTLVIQNVAYGKDQASVSITNNNDLYTSAANLGTLKANDKGAYTFTANVFGTALKDDSGTIYDQSISELTLDALNAFKTAGLGNLVFLNAELVGTDGKDLTVSDVAGLTTPSTSVTVAAKDGKATADFSGASAETVLANLDTDAAELTVTTDSHGLTVAGNDGTLFGNAETVKVTGTAGLTLGYAGAGKSGTVAAELDVSKDSQITVAAGDFTAQGGVTLGENAKATVENGASFTVAHTTGGEYVMNGGTLAILGNAPQEQEKALLDDAETGFEGALKMTSGITIGQNVTGNVIALGASKATARAAAEAAYGDALADKNVYYIGTQIDNNTMSLDSSYGVIVDLAGVAATEGYDAKDGVMAGTLAVADGETSELKLLNLNAKALAGEAGQKTLKLAGSVTGTGTMNVDYGTIFYGTNVKPTWNTTDGTKLDSLTGISSVDATTGTVSFVPNQNVLHLVDDYVFSAALEDAVNNVSFGKNTIIDKVVFGLDDLAVSAYNDFVAANPDATDEEIRNAVADKLDSALSQAEDVSFMGVLGGAFSTAVDINNENAKALARRMSAASGIERAAQGVNAWVDVIGTTNEAKNLFASNYGYEADIYGAMFGVDWTAPCGAILGLAVNVGQADANSTGDATDVDNDVDYYGVSIYGSHQVGLVNGMFDVGYTHAKNDLSASTVLGGFSESLDADLFTVGLGAECLAKAGAVNVVPHAGLRWTRIDMDDSKFGAEYDTMNLWQMPIGVTFSGTFETASWKLAPSFDLSVVPTFGDKDASAKYFGTTSESIRVVDSNPVQATLGVAAQTGAWTFGVNYGLTAGSDDRLNNSFNANARYTF